VQRVQKKGKAQLGLAFDRTSERIAPAFQTFPTKVQSRVNHPKAEITLKLSMSGGESVRIHRH
jgi:hypothetical protein